MIKTLSDSPGRVDQTFPGSVHVGLERQCVQFFAEPFTALEPGIAPGDALRAVVVAGEGAEVFKFADGAFGIECHRRF